MPKGKIKFALRMSPETQQLVKEMCPRDNCQTQSEFIEKAIRFYAGYVSGQEAAAYLPPTLVSALRATVQDSESRIRRLLFKLAVEMDMMNILASEIDIPEAVACLLEEISGGSFAPAQTKKEKPKKEFALPPAASNMRRVFAYLVGTRCVSREALAAFAHAGLVYESAGHHNAVFVGTDERGIALHAHLRSTNGRGEAFRLNMEGGDPQYSFHWTGTDGNLSVVKSPIDLLSYITLYPADWQRRSYVACCGTSGLPVSGMLDRHPNLRRIWLCLGNDRAGHTASQRMTEQNRERGLSSSLYRLL